ncbi:hypothetical protein [Vibrio parahaemolyticus]|uniref:hypothetical protein n=1 Tax=Vibrio parahaemolyticus TaxID=670 RepID=UPI001E64B0ED|nr:hypothetical protein [Vibrio parahaemolyticus]
MMKDTSKQDLITPDVQGSSSKDSDATTRLKAMMAACEAGVFTSPNRPKDSSKPKRAFEKTPDNVTVYASL